ncbi:MAG: hypothetical protein COB53_05730 [Elusimicrobia bacterium]|nr:MAG: hypothetical protein COB53_05730 [Elusimicrobiota bacterium]
MGGGGVSRDWGSLKIFRVRSSSIAASRTGPTGLAIPSLATVSIFSMRSLFNSSRGSESNTVKARNAEPRTPEFTSCAASSNASKASGSERSRSRWAIA